VKIAAQSHPDLYRNHSAKKRESLSNSKYDAERSADMFRINIAAITIVGLSLLTAGCSHHAFVSLTPGENIRDIEIPSGSIEQIRNQSSAIIVGLAYQKGTDRIFARLIPGTSMREIDRKTGAVVRSFVALQVTPGCGGISPGTEQPVTECGLAMRWSDKHFFLDNPTGNPITEVDFNGNFVRHIILQSPGGPIGGLAYDQRTDTLYVLYITIMTVAEYDLNGREIRRFRPQAQVQPQAMSMSSDRRELYIPLVNATHIGVFDLNGALKASHRLPSVGFAGGVGAGPRFGR